MHHTINMVPIPRLEFSFPIILFWVFWLNNARSLEERKKQKIAKGVIALISLK